MLPSLYIVAEEDPRLNEEDKALARFQAQRIREAKKSTRFHLQDGAAAAADGGTPGRSGLQQQQQQQHMLTHGGVSLEELEEMNARPTELLGDLDDDLLEDLVQQYHFGGGQEAQEGAGGEAGGQRKTKKQVRGGYTATRLDQGAAGG
jgi:nucleolar protein 14